MTSHRLLALLTSVALAASAAAPATARPAPAPVVQTSTGSLRGAIADGVASWKGIPFATPPIGALRWRAPQPVAPWPGVRDATAYSHDCMQLPFPSDAAPLGTQPAEDCLYANVWKPAAARGKLPVIVWIYGGGFVNGGASPPTYAGAALARQGVVVVSFNYRVGRFGSFAFPQLTAADADGGRLGNYGIMDQIAALQWVRRTVARFGGDPANVTIMGESAGGRSVHALVTSPLATGLFGKAIVMSGGDARSDPAATLAGAEQIGIAFARNKGIDPTAPDALARLRALSAEQVTDGLNLATMPRPGAGPATYGGPFVDGTVAVDIRRVYASGRFAKVPMLIGATSADIGGTKGSMIAGGREVAALLADTGMPVWAYRFSYVADSIGTPGAQHASDIPYFLDTADIKYGAATTPKDKAVARAISRAIVTFARTGTPNGAGLPNWPRYARATDQLMDFGADGTAVARADPWGAEIDAKQAAIPGK
ncbi:carboxylesterase family protein [Sphingomonas sp. RB3P16]|uniref:carboxylesterase/lipase family protein n=1 Tax=Parasphingomonas frigoris TaxID=3096163 RepID=UPI002FC7E8D6